MSDLPDQLDRKTHVEAAGWPIEGWIRRAILLVITGVVAAGLASVFGQRPSSESGTGAAAALTVEAPSALRGGVVWQALFRIDAVQALAAPELVFDQGWFDSMTLNSTEPEAADQSFEAGRSVFTYGPVPAGGQLVVRLQFQVNPTALGRRSQSVSLQDQGDVLAHVSRSVFVYP
jgi:hypothetical protein